MKSVITFMLGVVTGTVVGYLACQDRFSKLADEEIASVKKRYQKEKKEAAKVNVSEEEEESAEMAEDYEIEGGEDPVIYSRESMNQDRNRHNYVKDYSTDDKEEEKILQEGDKLNKEREEVKQEIDETMLPYLRVSDDEFDQEFGEYDREMLLWYTENGIVRDADNKDAELGDEETVILECLNDQVPEMPDDDLVYLVNKDRQIRYEVVCIDDPFPHADE